MSMQIFRVQVIRKHIDEFKAKEQAMRATRQTASSKRNILDSLLRSKSLANFRSRASSTPSSPEPLKSPDTRNDSDFDPGKEDSDEMPSDSMAAIIAENMGSGSIAPGYRQKAKQPVASSHKAVQELHRSMEALQAAEMESQAATQGNQADFEYLQFEAQRAVIEKTELAKIQLMEDWQSDPSSLDRANVSEELRNMVTQSAKRNQTEIQAEIFAAKLATLEQTLSEVVAASKKHRSNATATAHIRQYASEAEMKLELEVDKVTFVVKEDHMVASQSDHRTCLVDGCTAEVVRNKKVCLLNHPVDVRQLICPWKGCDTHCYGTTEQKLKQPSCLECHRPLIHSQTDPLVRLELMKLVAELNEKDGAKYDGKPKGGLLDRMSDSKSHITESECKWWRLLRRANNPENFVVALGAHRAKDALEEVFAVCSQVHISKILGRSVDFKINEKCLWAMFKGAAAGDGCAFKIYELMQVSGCSQDKECLTWAKNCLKEEAAEPKWENPNAITWLQQFLEAFSVLLTYAGFGIHNVQNVHQKSMSTPTSCFHCNCFIAAAAKN